MEEKRRWGCGFEFIRGEVEYQYSNSKDPFNHTCPQFFASQPAVIQLLNELRDYKRGAIDINKISYAHLAYLRAIECEAENHKLAQQEQLSGK